MATGSGTAHAPNPLLGNLLCFFAQLGTATQIVVEEKFMRRFRCHPVLAVGLEGFWGLVLCAAVTPWLPKLSATGVPFDDVALGLQQARPLSAWSLRGFITFRSIHFTLSFACSVIHVYPCPKAQARDVFHSLRR